jgi:hypothetical protein
VSRIGLTLGVDRYVRYVEEGCVKWGDQSFEVTYAADGSALSLAARACQSDVAAKLARLRDKVVAASGACNAVEFAERRCNRSRRDRKIAKALAVAHRGAVKRCVRRSTSSASSRRATARRSTREWTCCSIAWSYRRGTTRCASSRS